ncbi:tRNA pseudouridine(38-40) synthase TruA [Granulicella arctica]|uniref:tRNA pseudouridine synthase A n=1 Tax=Granulicella arctica TaxID=940613 RepID=A0A7Y9PIH5_9BACT|nr:tRNA pseudouridine(38-40) synthase TruA [Granulicella arctica]NYF80369.1 tRNA pseudouridine38-40 synthase [Granulicella arctica]
MQIWKITLSYDGTPFHGWQIQPGLATVQGTLAAAIRHVTGETVLPQGSGRTDTGVHALGQVASFALECGIPGENLHRALNRALPTSIRVLAVEAMTEGFHARHSAVRKSYEYRIFHGLVKRGQMGIICSPMLAPYVWDCPLPLDLTLLQEAATHVLGTHDFTSFAASDPDRATREAEVPVYATGVRRIDRSCWQERDGLYVYSVTGSGFLHHMVRNMMGTFVEVGAGRLSPDSIPGILAARSRSAAGPTAPARGLFLVEVEY